MIGSMEVKVQMSNQIQISNIKRFWNLKLGFRHLGFYLSPIERTASTNWPNAFSNPNRFLLADPAKEISPPELFGILTQTL